MSYPLHSLPTVSASRSVCTEMGFWGLDSAGGALTAPIRRAADTQNLLWQGEALRRRPGSIPVGEYPGQIHGIYFLNGECIVHAGTGLYRNVDGTPEQIFDSMSDRPSVGFVRRQTVTQRLCVENEPAGWFRKTYTGDFLFINDGTNYLFYDGQGAHSIVDPEWGGMLRSRLDEGETFSFYSAIPLTATGKLPDGSGGDHHPRGDNLVSQFHGESFYVSDAADCATFVFDIAYSELNTGIPAELMIRDNEGIWRSYYCITKELFERTEDGRAKMTIDTPIRGGMKFSYDSDGRIVNLGVGIYNLANDGMDNVRIFVAVRKEEPAMVRTATVQGFFGPDGTDSVLFLGGSSAAPGVDTFSAPDDFFCFYATSVERLGDERVPITGYCLLPDGRMAVLKNDPSGSNVYFRSHTVVSVGQTLSGEPFRLDAYPSRMGAAVEGCISARTVGISGNEPVFLGASGLYGVRSVSNELTNLNETVRRSGPIDPLLDAMDRTLACAVTWQGYYLLTFGEEGFITDGRRDGSGALRFLKWRFSSRVTALGKQEDLLYWGSDQGQVFRLAQEGEDAQLPEAYWHCYLPADGSGRRQNLKQLSASLCPDYEGRVRLRLYREQTPTADQSLAVHRSDFSDWDFGEVSFDGSNSARWMALPAVGGPADGYAMRLYLDAGERLLLWGLRMIYEKGGTVR